ncbi:hypothetical protein CRG98_016971 [Punica granatum]|uniref:Uncharacterized protein n=1 Tax=Punica granatum TaxID=22663 RepID=A0A2I0K3I0_PUNGR|nr:hypothetical protein CRG98_016971 [Punica granatum]
MAESSNEVDEKLQRRTKEGDSFKEKKEETPREQMGLKMGRDLPWTELGLNLFLHLLWNFVLLPLLPRNYSYFTIGSFYLF